MPKGIYPRKLTDPVPRFWAKVNKDGPVPEYAPHLGPCWLWTGAVDPYGYGRFNPTGRTITAYRYAYELVIGPVPEGLTLDHLCRVHACVNPAHLEPVTLEENTRRGLSPPTLNARKTHCKHGHEFTEENTYRPPGRPRQRHCKACLTEHNRARYGGDP